MENKAPMTLDELKKEELEILIQLDEICKKEGIRYSLAAGTLLGAIRHGGFIPWDDDIDIFLPRPDYDRLVKYCMENETPFDFLSHETNDKYTYLFAKAMSKRTVVIERNANPYKIPLGVYVDIFPVDGMGDNLEDAKRVFKSIRFERELLIARNWTKYQKNKSRSFSYNMARLAFYLLSRFTTPKAIMKRLKKKSKCTDFDLSAYAGCIPSAYRIKESFDIDVYKEYTKTTFEGREFSIIKNYDKYLTGIYVNYMELPPEDKRITHHSFDAYYKENV